MTTLWDKWNLWPFWAKAATCLSAFYIVVATFRVAGESRPVGGFAEELSAMLIRDGAIFGGVIAAIAIGMAVGRKYPTNKIAGWLAGLAVLAIAWSIPHFAASIPGVGWRIEQMNDAEPLDNY